MSTVALVGVTGLSTLGVVFLGLGTFLMAKGFAARREITAALLEENATTPSSWGRPEPVALSSAMAAPAGAAPDPPPVEPIHDSKTAQLRIDEIKGRTLYQMGPYQQLPVDGQERQHFLNGMVIRNALSLAIMGYGVSNLVIALGATLLALGAASLALGIPLVYAIDR